MSTIPKQDTSLNKSTVLTLLIALLLGWFAVPLLTGAAGAVLFFVVVAAIILVIRIIDRSNALIVVIGVVVGVLIGLLVPQLNSSALSSDGLVRAFLVLYLVLTV